MVVDYARLQSFDEAWPPNDTEVSCLGTNLHQTTITNLRTGLDEAACAYQEPGQPLPWTALSQTLLLGCRRPDGSYYRTYPDVFVYLAQVDPYRGSMTLDVDGPPALIIELVSESSYETDIDLTRGKGYSYAHAGVLEYIAMDPTGEYLPRGVAAWRLADESYAAWRPREDGRWYSEQAPVAFALEGAQAAVYLADGRRMPLEREIYGLVDALARKDEEIARLKRMLDGR